MRNLILSLALALAPMVSMGCTSDGDGGGGDGQQALSFDGDTALPATGGAAIGIELGTRLAATLSAVFQALADNANPAPSLVRPKGNFDFFCATGEADLDGLPVAETTATLTLTDCAGSPLSSTAVNGRMLLEFRAVAADFSSFSALASFDGPMAGGQFTIAGDPNTTLAGTFVVENVTFDPSILNPSSFAMHLSQRDDPSEFLDLITISEGEGEGKRTLQLGCFDISTSSTVDPPAITSYQASGVLSLDGKIYTLNDPDNPEGADGIGFPPGSAVPSSGSLTLYSGDKKADGCETFQGLNTGDVSTTTATFEAEPPGRVTMEVAGVTGCFECETTWENLLNTLSDIASPDSCSAVSCDANGGPGEVPYCASYADESHTCLAFPDLGNDVLVEIEGETITYKMTVDGVEVSATGAWNAGDRTGSGTGDFVNFIDPPDTCTNPSPDFQQTVRFGFDITFANATRTEYTGTIELDFTLDPNCGPSICFASASVTGMAGSCPL